MQSDLHSLDACDTKIDYILASFKLHFDIISTSLFDFIKHIDEYMIMYWDSTSTIKKKILRQRLKFNIINNIILSTSLITSLITQLETTA
jgi:hypothetical protein